MIHFEILRRFYFVSVHVRILECVRLKVIHLEVLKSNVNVDNFSLHIDIPYIFS